MHDIILGIQNHTSIQKFDLITIIIVQYKLLKGIYLRSSIIEAGFSRYDFHRFENLATVAPSMTLWSADHVTCMMCALVT